VSFHSPPKSCMKLSFINRMVMSLSTFGAGLHMRSEEMDSLKPLADAVVTLVILANDFYSWDKEQRTHIRMGHSRTPANAISIVMASESIDASAARSAIKKKVAKLEEEYLTAKEEYFSVMHRSFAEKKYVSLLEGVYTCMVLWGSTCSRYNPSAPIAKRENYDLSAKEYPGCWKTLRGLE